MHLYWRLVIRRVTQSLVNMIFFYQSYLGHVMKFPYGVAFNQLLFILHTVEEYIGIPRKIHRKTSLAVILLFLFFPLPSEPPLRRSRVLDSADSELPRCSLRFFPHHQSVLVSCGPALCFLNSLALWWEAIFKKFAKVICYDSRIHCEISYE